MGDSTAAAAEADKNELLEISLNWKGKKIDLEIEVTSTYSDLKLLIYSETSVRPEHQKLSVRHKGKGCPDGLILSELELKKRQKIRLMGTPEDEIEELENQHNTASAEAGIVLDDFDWDINPDSYTLWSRSDAERSLIKMIKKKEINIMNPPRIGKPLLVLDLDHTLLHFSRHVVNTDQHHEMMRPYMHTFLEKAYRHYDIVVWSQTKWTWVEIKLTELGMLSNPKYEVSFILDTTAMFKVVGFKDGVPKRHKVKALGLIWAKFNHWSRKNTIHIDDLSRNFAMNPECGLKCTAFNRKKTKSSEDTELLQIAAYLELLATKHSDFTDVDHSKWREYLREHEERQN